jgi:hypothetical protein
MYEVKLPPLSEEPTPYELDAYYSVLIRHAGPDCDVSQFLGTLRTAMHDRLFSISDREDPRDEFELVYYSIPTERDALKTTIQRLKGEVWGGHTPSRTRDAE